MIYQSVPTFINAVRWLGDNEDEVLSELKIKKDLRVMDKMLIWNDDHNKKFHVANIGDYVYTLMDDSRRLFKCSQENFENKFVLV